MLACSFWPRHDDRLGAEEYGQYIMRVDRFGIG
jgi:hypothetical protein